MVQLSHLYMTIGKTIALTMQTFIGKVIFLLFNTPFRFVIAFLPRTKYLFISWLLRLVHNEAEKENDNDSHHEGRHWDYLGHGEDG